MGDANQHTPLDSAPAEYTTQKTVASLSVGSELVRAMLSLEPVQSKTLLFLAYNYAQTKSPWSGSLQLLAEEISTTKDKARHALQALSHGKLIGITRAGDTHSYLVGEKYRISETSSLSPDEASTPKNSSRRKAPLEPKFAPFGLDPSDCKVRLTKEQEAALLAKFGEEQACFLVDQLDDYLTGNPTKRYPSHYLTILNWDRMSRERGKVFCSDHPRLGKGYFPLRDVER